MHPRVHTRCVFKPVVRAIILSVRSCRAWNERYSDSGSLAIGGTNQQPSQNVIYPCKKAELRWVMPCRAVEGCHEA